MAGTYPQNSYGIQEGLVWILKMDEALVRVEAARRRGEDKPPRRLNPNKSMILQANPLISKILVDDKKEEPSTN